MTADRGILYSEGASLEVLMIASIVAKLISEVIAPVQLLDTLLAVASMDSCSLAVLLLK